MRRSSRIRSQFVPIYPIPVQPRKKKRYLEKSFDDRDRECAGLPGSGLGERDDVAPLQRVRDRLRLVMRSVVSIVEFGLTWLRGRVGKFEEMKLYATYA
jgi:hypothetical protein